MTCDNEFEFDKPYCFECNTTFGYYPLYDDNSTCIHEESNNVGYYLDKEKSPIMWRNCYENCRTCLSQGNETIMNCLSCKDDFFYIRSKSNCVSNCPYGYEKDEIKKECIIKEFDQTTTVSDFKNLIVDDITQFVNSSKVINGSDFLAVVLSSDNMNPEEQLKNGISAVVLGNCTEVIKEYYNISKEENLIVLNMESKREEKNKSESDSDNSFNLGKNIQLEVFDFSGRKLDLSVCKEDIKVMKYIGDVEELNIQSAKDLANNGVDAFNARDDFFNDICHPFDDPNGKDIILNDRRADLYQNATFCQDGCSYNGVNYDLMAAHCICDSSYLQSEEKNETIKEESIENEVVNFKTITKSFISNLLDFNFDVIYCTNLAFNSKIIIYNIGFYSLALMFISQIIFLILYLLKKLRPLKNNLLFNNKSYNWNKYIINNDIAYNKATPPPKNSNSVFSSFNSKEMTNDTKKINIINDNNFKKGDNSENPNNLVNVNKNDLPSNNFNSRILSKNRIYYGKQPIISQNYIQNININIQANLLNINNNKKISKFNNLIDNSERQEINLNNNLSVKNKDNVDNVYNLRSPNFYTNKNTLDNNNNNINKKIYNMETLAEKKDDIIKKNIFEIYLKQSESDIEIQDMDYEEAIIYDKRSFIKIYWAFLVDSQIILGTFCTDNHLNLFVIKLSFFICTFQISFFLNALFYTDEYISDAYHNDGVLDFVSGLPKSIYSFIATLITTNLLKMLSNSQSELMKLIREKFNYLDYLRIMEYKLKKLRIKLIIYFILVVLLGLLFLYYVTSFCAVYRHSQKYWFYGCLESFGIDSLVSLVMCILLSLFRYISLKKRIKCFYTLANILITFF